MEKSLHFGLLVGLLPVVLGLTACGKEQSDQVQSERIEVTEYEDVPTKAEVKQAGVKEDETPKANPAEPTTDVQPVAAAKQPERIEKKKKLNLTIPLDTNLDSIEVAEKAPDLLPNMFAGKSEGTKVSGNVIRDEENKNFMDTEAIQGAEVSVEFKTD